MRRFNYLLLLLGIVAVTFFYSRFKNDVAPGSAVKIHDPNLDEISGMTLSKHNAGNIWVNNDGFQRLKLFLIDEFGRTKKVFQANAWVWDLEDITIDPGLVDGKPYIYAADIGDNFGSRNSITILKIPEPHIGDSSVLNSVEKFNLKYPDGSRDAETILIDPLSKHLYIVSKRGKTIGVYTLPLRDMVAEKTVFLRKVATLSLNDENDELQWITSGNVSPDGRSVVLRCYSYVYYWDRKDGQQLEDALKVKPRCLEHIREYQGEAISFSQDSKGFYTLSEGRHAPLNYNAIKQ
jgi:hypothetical protein